MMDRFFDFLWAWFIGVALVMIIWVSLKRDRRIDRPCPKCGIPAGWVTPGCAACEERT